jgi:lactoylglutathione lyase
MTVRRIVANVLAGEPEKVAAFYRDLLGLEMLMDMGWIVTLGTDEQARVQMSIATEGGSGTPLPALSIEVDDLDEALRRVRAAGVAIEYGPVEEPWGVRRFFVRDPVGTLVNILMHL